MKIRIRTKLAAALLVPLAALVALSGYEALEAREEVDDVRSEAELASVSIGPSSLTTELQNERNYTALELLGLADTATLEVGSVSEARERVDGAVADLGDYLEGRDAVVGDAFAPAFETLEAELGEARAMWDEYDGPKDLSNQPLADDVFERFTTMTQAFFDATQTVATEIDDNALRNGSEIVDQSNRRGELQARITRAIVLDTLTEGGESGYRAEVASMRARVVATEERIDQLSVGPYAGVAEETLGRSFDEETAGYIEDYVAGESVEIPQLLAAVSAGGADGVTSAAEMAAGILTDEADRLTSEAETREQQFLVLAAGVVAIAILFSWLASRSITRPLLSLRTQADEMAKTRLPHALREISETPMGDDVRVPELEPISVDTRDEVGEVAEVLNDVQDRTLQLAADQAVLRRNVADSFVNLGRRNQNLLDRQLEFITELEQSETEPEELESLFRLDHLATRMRRNAESLLVLAGTASPRQWSAPVHVDDVVRAALGEVEDYRRVSLRHIDDVSVAGEAAAGVSHVLAELMENALQFSPPETTVEVKGRLNADGYMIAIDDDGIGMSPEAIERANRRLSGAEAYTVAPSRYLGHYVAGNLAGRLGVAVALQDSPAGGVTATVRIPQSLLADPNADVAEANGAGAPGESAPVRPSEEVGPEEVGLDPISMALAPSAEDREPAVADAPEAPAEAQPALETTQPAFETAQPAFETAQPAFETTQPAFETTQPVDESAPSPLPRRVPGAQRPDRQPTIANRAVPADTGDDRGRDPTGALGFLSGFSAGASGSSDPDGSSPGERSGDGDRWAEQDLTTDDILDDHREDR